MKKGKRQERLPELVLEELAAIGLTRATDVLSISDGQVGIKNPDQMGAGCAAAIAAVEKTTGGWKVKFYDKLKALELLGEHFGLFGPAASPAEENNLLEAILAATEEEIRVNDIQELQQASDPGDDLVE